MIVVVGMLLACGDNTGTCDDRWESYIDACRCCYAAQVFAARDTSDVAPAATYVERYFDRWKRAVDKEPILRGRTPQTYRATPPEFLDINTTNPAVIDAWSHQRVMTTDARIDEVISQLGTVTIEPRYAPDPAPGEPWYFEIRETRVYSEDRLDSALHAGSAWLNAPTPLPRDDGTWTWLPGNTAQVDFTFGWGDCFVACTGFHTLRAIIPETGDATVYDLGGDPLPDYLHLDSRTKPMP